MKFSILGTFVRCQRSTKGAAYDIKMWQFRNDIFRQAVRYIERRARRPVTEVCYDDILEMAGALGIKQIDVH